MNKHIQNITKGVLEKITAENVTMHSKYYFLLRGALLVTSAVLLLALTLYTVSMIGFIFIGNGMGVLPGFGMVGVFIMLRSLPWLLILTALGFVFLLEYLGAQFSFVYKRPLVYSLLGVFVITIIGGVLLAQTNMHNRMFALGEEYRVPGAGRMYQGYILRKSGDVNIGTIISISEDSLNMTLREGGDKLIKLTEHTKQPPHMALTEGDMVMVIIEEKGGANIALGMRLLERRRMLMPRMQAQ